MTAAQPGDAFHLDLDGTVITGRYIEVDPPRRLVSEWNRQGTEPATPIPALVEITLTPTGDGTNVNVQLSGLSPEDEAVNLSSGRATLTGSQLPWLAANPRMSTESGAAHRSASDRSPGPARQCGRSGATTSEPPWSAD